MREINKSMEISADIRQKVHINPLVVIEKLIEDEIGNNSWIFEKGCKYYRGYELSAGSRSINEEEEITKERYNYVKALQLVLNFNKNKSYERKDT